MSVTVKVTQVGNSLGVILPKEVLAKLKAEKGQVLHVTDTPDGVALTSYDPEFDEVLDIIEDVSSRYRNTLRALAK
ncbi:MAG: AbrB/MazE/SpoVT family DNA-binding domain-containing protein [Pseudomonadota bacterium]